MNRSQRSPFLPSSPSPPHHLKWRGISILSLVNKMEVNISKGCWKTERWRDGELVDITTRTGKVSDMGTFLVAPVMNREVVCANQNRNVLMLWNMPSHKLSRSPLPLATCVSFSGLRYHCQFHALKTAIQISLTSGRCFFFFYDAF